MYFFVLFPIFVTLHSDIFLCNYKIQEGRSEMLNLKTIEKKEKKKAKVQRKREDISNLY